MARSWGFSKTADLRHADVPVDREIQSRVWVFSRPDTDPDHFEIAAVAEETGMTWEQAEKATMRLREATKRRDHEERMTHEERLALHEQQARERKEKEKRAAELKGVPRRQPPPRRAADPDAIIEDRRRKEEEGGFAPRRTSDGSCWARTTGRTRSSRRRRGLIA